MPIKNIYARQIFDAVGDPTVEVDLITDLGLFRAAVPSGVTKGNFQALDLRDGLKKHFFGKSVNKAIANVNDIIGPQLIEQKLEVIQQCEIDEFLNQLDGTENKSSMGVNAILAVSMAVCKAGAAKRGLPLYKHIASLAGNENFKIPVPAFNVMNGGNNAGNPLPFAEFTIMPIGAQDFKEAMKMGSEVYHHLKVAVLKKFGKPSGAVADEGGFAPPKLKDAKKALTIIKAAIKKSGYTGKVEIGMNCAANVFFKKGKYDLKYKKKKSPKKGWLPAAKLQKMYLRLIKKFKLVSIEDPFGQTDLKAWKKFTAKTDIQVLSTNLTVSNIERIQLAAEQEACNSMVLMMNHTGTITESIKAYQSAKEAGWGMMIADRSGDTEDTFIADFVVGVSAGLIKTGAPCRSERLAKYNQILRIEEELGEKAKYAGQSFRSP